MSNSSIEDHYGYSTADDALGDGVEAREHGDPSAHGANDRHDGLNSGALGVSLGYGPFGLVSFLLGG